MTKFFNKTIKSIFAYLDNSKDVLVNFIFIILLFINTISILPYFSELLRYLDEIIEIALGIYLLFNIKLVFKKKKIYVVMVILFLFLGLISTLVFSYQTLFATVMDGAIIIPKFIIGYLFGYTYSKKHKIKLTDCVFKLTQLITIIIFVIAVHDLLFDPFFEKSQFRYFTYSLKLMFSHPTYLSVFCITLIAILTCKLNYKENLIFILMNSFVVFFTFRSKAIVFVVLYWIFYVLIFLIQSRKLKLIILTLGLVGSLAIASASIYANFFKENQYSPRSILTTDSISLANDHFPLGTGFGTFGTTIAAQYYSPIYIDLGYENNFGMSSDNTSFLSDCFWPGIVAQFGYIGTIIFIVILLYYLIRIYSVIKINRIYGFALLSIMLYMLITSTAESSFFNPTSFLLFIIFGSIEANFKRCKEI